jgi:hypothetical protein
MWEQSLLTSSGQVQALRLLSEWWDSSRRGRASWRQRRAVGAAGTRAGDVVVLPPGYRPGHLDEPGAAPTGP